ncbi:modification methylase [Sphingobacteriales bacterium UPWRP_1]|nr:modification methylase [Sphingobacteriales bacterium TSM_CSS]PSJ76936.1 modification methylase [Sphingobacteriales bacterium UPWRP_1]
MKYQVIRNEKYDYIGQSYATQYPNLHKYPATMLPQIGIDILKELNVSSGKLLDPYCGSGSSFASGLECGITDMYGFDINPLAILISKVKFTKISLNTIVETKMQLRDSIFDFIKIEDSSKQLTYPNVTNIEFWFSKEVLNNLNIIKHFINHITDENLKRFFLLPFSETVRECSYTRNNEFKLYRMKSEDILNFNPDVLGVYFKKLNETIFLYTNIYFPKLTDEVKVDVQYSKFQPKENSFDVVLTSPPYGDSRTTVAYGQFSALSNEWIGIDYARKIDGMLMGGTKAKANINKGVIADYISHIDKADNKRALEVSAFYLDLGNSIKKVANSIKKGGKSIYVVGNRTVKNVQLPTDQFIAEKFEENGFKHLTTYERLLSNKAMPSKNSPTNEAGKTVNTMLYEYIVICEKAN